MGDLNWVKVAIAFEDVCRKLGGNPHLGKDALECKVVRKNRVAYFGIHRKFGDVCVFFEEHGFGGEYLDSYISIPEKAEDLDVVESKETITGVKRVIRGKEHTISLMAEPRRVEIVIEKDGKPVGLYFKLI